MSVKASAVPPPEPRPAPRVSYQDAAAPTPRTLAQFRFGDATAMADERIVQVPLRPLRPTPIESWEVDTEVERGRQGPLRWAAGGGWLFSVVEIDEAAVGGPHAAAREAYACLTGFLAERGEHRVLRMWNYLPAINDGDGDAERYKRFCDGRVEGMGDFFRDGYPAATAIGHHQTRQLLQVYSLSATIPGERVENPRQLSAWRYPRRYGRTSPTFARAMRLPHDGPLAISGTAAITGHTSRHPGDVEAQLAETLANLDALLESGGMPGSFGPSSPLKVYVRHPEHLAQVEAILAERLPGVPHMFLEGDVCRAELLVEIDGWCFGPEAK